MSEPVVIVSAAEAETIDLTEPPSVVVVADADAEQAGTAAADLRTKGFRTAVFVGGPENQAAIDEFVQELFVDRS